jgi:hypothetical protein
MTSLPCVLMFMILDMFYDDKPVLMSISKSFKKKYKHHIRHIHKMMKIRNDISIKYLDLKLYRHTHPHTPRVFHHIFNVECEEHIVEVRKWYDKKRYPKQPKFMTHIITYTSNPNNNSSLALLYREYLDKCI